MRIGYVQMMPEHHDVNANLASIEKLIAGVDADLLVLPELCLTGYLFKSREELRDFAQPIRGGQSFKLISKLARTADCNLVLGTVERYRTRLYNSAVIITRRGRILSPSYRKLHLFWDEKDLFDPGNIPPTVYHLDEGISIGLMVCFDWAFPELPRSLAIQGADVICHCANLVLPYAQGAAVTRAIENRVFVILANRTGVEELGAKRLHFTGHSRIVEPGGTILREADGNSQRVDVVDIDIEKARDKMLTPRNHALNDRRPEMYTQLGV